MTAPTDTETIATPMSARVRCAGRDLDDLGPPTPGFYYLVLEVPNGHNDLIQSALTSWSIGLVEIQPSAPTETPSLTTEQARELARRWAEKCRACQRDRDAPDADAECTDFLGRETKPLADPEREQLFAWVRAQEYTPHPMRHAGWLMERLDLDHASSLALCQAAGWPS